MKLTSKDTGVGTISELRQAGMSKHQIDTAVSAGTLRRLRRGWYATSAANPTVSAAVAAGGVLSCISALKMYGVWIPPVPPHTHIRGSKSAHSRHGGAPFCNQFSPPEAETAAVDDVLLAFRHSLRCLDDEGIVVASDSLLNRRLITGEDLASAFADAPHRIQRLHKKTDGRAQAGTETIVRLRLRARRIRCRPQFYIPGIGFVDLLVGESLILEADSKEFHTGSRNYESDRARDREAVRLGFTVLRLSYGQIMYDWSRTAEAIGHLVSRRQHRRPPPVTA